LSLVIGHLVAALGLRKRKDRTKKTKGPGVLTEAWTPTGILSVHFDVVLSVDGVWEPGKGSFDAQAGSGFRALVSAGLGMKFS
jgi:hypothetical protein